LMDAFQCDCQTLLTRFELTYNTHFQNFCEIWREMQFSLIFDVYYMVTDKAKFRMTLSDWKCLMDLHQKVKVEEYLDANYILCKLIVDRAFIHCLSDIE
ncbi:hypothetical protein EAI_01639, partial [Harpegnathos saltator]